MMTLAAPALVAVLSLSAAPRAKRPPAAAPTPAAAPAPGPQGPRLDLTRSSVELLGQARALERSLDFAEVLTLGRELEKRADLSTEQRLEAYFLLGCALAVVQDPIDAEPVFRRLLSLRPDWPLPQGTPAKIKNAFVKVQRDVEEANRLADQLRREEQVRRIRLLDELPRSAQGGQPLLYALRVQDPDALVSRVLVHYRRVAQPTYSALALERTAVGDWAGQLPAELTADPNGFVLEHWVETQDGKGRLLTVGSEQAPLEVAVSAGEVRREKRKPPLPRGPFIAATSLAVVSAGVGLGFGVAKLLADAERRAPSLTGTDLIALDARRTAFANVTTAALISAGLLAVTALVLAFLTDF